jgi:ATP-dependent Clp protease protease subunit
MGKQGKEKDERRELKDYGVVFINGPLSDDSAQRICEQIITINLEGQAQSVQLIINSPGGTCSAGFAIVDLIEWSSLPVHTLGIGLIASMALVVFMAGERGHRVLTNRTSILSHRFSGLSFGNYSELLARRKEEDWLHRRLLDHYLVHTTLGSEQEVHDRLLRDVDTWLTPAEALGMGIADVIQEGRGGAGEAKR